MKKFSKIVEVENSDFLGLPKISAVGAHQKKEEEQNQKFLKIGQDIKNSCTPLTDEGFDFELRKSVSDYNIVISLKKMLTISESTNLQSVISSSLPLQAECLDRISEVCKIRDYLSGVSHPPRLSALGGRSTHTEYWINITV